MRRWLSAAAATAVVGSVAAAVTLAGAPRGPSVAGAPSSCGDHGWAGIASGRLAHALPASGVNYGLSHRPGRWRLTVRGSPGAVLSGRIVSDRRVRLVHRRSWAQRSARTIAFHADGSGHMRR